MHTGLKEYIENKKHHAFRRDYPEYKDIAKEYHALGLCPKERMTRRFELLSELETPVLLPDEKICLLRTVRNIPDCFTEEEWREIRGSHFIHERGYLSNLSPNYERVIGT